MAWTSAQPRCRRRSGKTSRTTVSTSSTRTDRSRWRTSCVMRTRRSRASGTVAASRSWSAGPACTCERSLAVSTRTPCHRTATRVPPSRVCLPGRDSVLPSRGSTGLLRSAPPPRTSPTPGGSRGHWRSPSSPATHRHRRRGVIPARSPGSACTPTACSTAMDRRSGPRPVRRGARRGGARAPRALRPVAALFLGDRLSRGVGAPRRRDRP